MKTEELGYFFKDLDKFYCEYYTQILELVRRLDGIHRERRNILEKYNLSNDSSFNIFEDLLIDKKFFEIDHSKIIAKILDSKNVVIGNKKHLALFINLIKLRGNISIDNFDFENYAVEREKSYGELGRIDILIYENKENGKCIIIENKITGSAPDQENQLSRYYQIVKVGLNKNLVAIVYLPFYYKNPDDCNYTGEYKNHKEKIKPLLCVIPAIEHEKELDFVHGFLDKCAEISDTDQTKAVCIKQYSNFIKSKAEKEKIIMNQNKQFLEKLLSDEKTREITEDIVEVWNDKESIIYEELKTRLLKNSFYSDSDENLLRDFASNSEVFLFINGNSEIGFGHKNSGFEKKLMKDLEEVLRLEERYNFLEFCDKDEGWVYSNYTIGTILGSYDNMYNYLCRLFDKLENEAVKLLK